MKRIFPIYKGNDCSKMGIGYSNVNGARKFMDKTKIVEDFNKSLSHDYWFQYLYTYENSDKKEKMNVHVRVEVEVFQYDIKKKIYIKDITNVKIKTLFCRLKSLTDIPYWERTDKNIDDIIKLTKEISSCGYYPYMWKNDKDYIKKLSKYIKENVNFVEKEVTITAN